MLVFTSPVFIPLLFNTLHIPNHFIPQLKQLIQVKTIHQSQLLSFLFLLIFLLSSFSVHFNRVDSQEPHPSPISKKESHRQQQLKKRYQRLQHRLNKAKKLHKRKKIQKKLNIIEQKQQLDSVNFSLIGFIFSLIATILLLATFCLLLIAASSVIAFLFEFAVIALFLGLNTGIVGLILSIIGFNKAKKDPNQNTRKKMSLWGIILGAITVAVLLVFAILIFIFN